MLVVLLIAGLVAGMVTLVAQPDDRALLRVEAERLARLLDVASAESGLTGKTLGWSADAEGYRFWRFQADTGWSEIRDSDLLRARLLPQGITIASLRVEGGRRESALRLEFSPYAPPQPFVIEMALGSERYGVAASPMGEVRAVPVGSGADG